MSVLSQLAQTYDTTYTTASSADSSMGVAAALIMTIIVTILSYVVGCYLLSRIFKKAGIDTWKAWVPVYNAWVQYELGGYGGWWSILLFIPFINIAAAIILMIAYYRIGLGFGKSGAFVLLAIFLPIVWMVWLAFDDSTWQKAPAQVGNPAFQPPQS